MKIPQNLKKKKRKNKSSIPDQCYKSLINNISYVINQYINDILLNTNREQEQFRKYLTRYC